MLRLTSFSAALLLLSTAPALAQGAPDLSGRWKLDPGRSTSVGGHHGTGRGGGGGRGGGLALGPPPEGLTIAQTATAITIVERGGVGQPRFVLRLDGVSVARDLPRGLRSGGPATTTTKIADGRVATHVSIPAMRGRPPRQYDEVRYLDAEGALVLEVSMTGQPNMRRLVYRKIG
jgi:hypothetical protein